MGAKGTFFPRLGLLHGLLKRRKRKNQWF